MMRGFTAAVVAALVLLPGVASAQTGQQFFYVEARGGGSFLNDSDLDFGGTVDVDLAYDAGWLAEGAVGYAFPSGLRGELAFGYRKNDFDELDIEFLGKFDVDGDISATTGMANLYYDFNLATYGGSRGYMANLVPFIGGGLGAANIEVDGDLGEEDDTVFAWQLMAGMAYNFTPNFAATATYVYFTAENLEFDGDVDAEYDSHNVLAGLRVSF